MKDKEKVVDEICSIVSNFTSSAKIRNGYYSQYKSEFQSYCVLRTQNDIMSELLETGFNGLAEAEEYIDLLIEEENENNK